MSVAWDNIAGNDGRQGLEIAVPEITQDGAIFSDVRIIENIVIDNADSDEKWQHVGIEVVVIAELKPRDKQQHIFAAHLVRAEWSDDSVFNAEYRPKRTHRVTPGLTRWSIVTPGV
jgi:hypothetical protein